MTVVPGPIAAKAMADEAPPDRPTAEESITLSKGDEIHSARAGPENMAISRMVGSGFSSPPLGTRGSVLPAACGGVGPKRHRTFLKGRANNGVGAWARNAPTGENSPSSRQSKSAIILRIYLLGRSCRLTAKLYCLLRLPF